MWQRRFSSVEGFRVTAHSATTLDFIRHLALVRRVRTDNIKLNIRVGESWIIFKGLGAPLVRNPFAIRRKVLHPDQRIVTNVLAYNRGGIKRGKIADTDGRRRIEAWFGVQHNRALIGVLSASVARDRQDRDDNIFFTTELEDKGFNLDALATNEDVTNRHGTDIRHGHGVIERLQLLIQV